MDKNILEEFVCPEMLKRVVDHLKECQECRDKLNNVVPALDSITPTIGYFIRKRLKKAGYVSVTDFLNQTLKEEHYG